jgi:hypothetical protein
MAIAFRLQIAIIVTTITVRLTATTELVCFRQQKDKLQIIGLGILHMSPKHRAGDIGERETSASVSTQVFGSGATSGQ